MIMSYIFIYFICRLKAAKEVKVTIISIILYINLYN